MAQDLKTIITQKVLSHLESAEEHLVKGEEETGTTNPAMSLAFARERRELALAYIQLLTID